MDFLEIKNMNTFFNKNFWIGLTYSYIGYVCGGVIVNLSEIERGSFSSFSLTFGGAILGSYIHTLLSKRKKISSANKFRK